MSNLTAEQIELARKTSGPYKQLFKLALPIMGMTVSRMLMGFIDFVMVSQLGTEAQAAISPCVMMIFTVACAGMGVSLAVQTFVSQADGRGEHRVAGSYAWQSIYVSAFMTAIVAVASFSTPAWLGLITELGEHSEEMAALEVEYTRIALWWVPLGILSMGLDGFFLGIQRPRVTLLAVVASLVTNAVGNYLLIFGKFGCPELGVAGAAIATVAGWAVRVAILTVAILMSEMDRKYCTRRSLAFRWDKLKGLLRVGLPTSVQWFVDVGAWLVFLALIMPPYGVHAVAASNIGLQYMHLSFMPALGIGIALCSQVGFAIGAGRPEEAEIQSKAAMRLTGWFMGAVGLLFVAAGGPMVSLMNSDPEVIAAGRWVLVGVAIFQVFDAMCITYTNSLRGAGDTRWPAMMFFVCCWAIFIGGGWTVAKLFPQWGIIGPWAMCTIYIIVLGLLLQSRWRAGRWRAIKLVAEKEALA